MVKDNSNYDLDSERKYLIERRKIVRTDEFIYYGALSAMFALRKYIPRIISYPVAALGGWFILRGYKYTGKLEKRLEEHENRRNK